MLDLKGDPKKIFLALLLTAICVVVAVLGWRTFYFFTDDAYIAFRYVSNSMDGHGFVWNPPPFKPVEGYTSFLWVALLRVIWSVTGLEPPQAANIVSLFFGLLTLVVVYRFICGMVLPGVSSRVRTLSGAIVFTGILANRTYLTWLSSGLETSLFNFLITFWLYLVFTAPPAEESRHRWTFSIALCAALLALCRPEGILPALATVGIAVIRQSWPGSQVRFGVLYYSPLLLVPAYLLWRRNFYGFWLPNTYYAKHVGAWPESGYRYLLSFILEYGVWIWIGLALVFLVQRLRTPHGSGPPNDHQRVLRLLGSGVLFVQLFYYTFVVGGDHFEFRIYSFLIPLLFVSAMFMLFRSFNNPRVVPGILLLFVLTSLPIPWTHWFQTRHLETKEETFMLIEPIASRFPFIFRAPVRIWDENQEWLIRHLVCMRHQEHKIAHEHLVSILPSRDEGRSVPWQDRAILAASAVGVGGWVFPEVAIIDRMGLNDLVIARASPPTGRLESRMMAHDRYPPPGYLECLQPNVSIDRSSGQPRITVAPRPDILTDAQITNCEDKYLDLVKGR